LIPGGDDPSLQEEPARRQSFTPLATVEGCHDGVDEVSVRSDPIDRALRECDGELRLEDEGEFQQIQGVCGEIVRERCLGYQLLDIDAELVGDQLLRPRLDGCP
jgi:hypothetical protein